MADHHQRQPTETQIEAHETSSLSEVSDVLPGTDGSNVGQRLLQRQTQSLGVIQTQSIQEYDRSLPKTASRLLQRSQLPEKIQTRYSPGFLHASTTIQPMRLQRVESTDFRDPGRSDWREMRSLESNSMPLSMSTTAALEQDEQTPQPIENSLNLLTSGAPLIPTGLPSEASQTSSVKSAVKAAQTTTHDAIATSSTASSTGSLRISRRADRSRSSPTPLVELNPPPGLPVSLIQRSHRNADPSASQFSRQSAANLPLKPTVELPSELTDQPTTLQSASTPSTKSPVITPVITPTLATSATVPILQLQRQQVQAIDPPVQSMDEPVLSTNVSTRLATHNVAPIARSPNQSRSSSPLVLVQRTLQAESNSPVRSQNSPRSQTVTNVRNTPLPLAVRSQVTSELLNRVPIVETSVAASPEATENPTTANTTANTTTRAINTTTSEIAPLNANEPHLAAAPSVDIPKVAEQVYRILSRRLSLDQERRGGHR
jgi:hypothetical protein